MGGLLSRYVQNDRVWWAFGFYFDVGPADDIYLPYLGASWQLTDQWTVSAIMPWPQILYAPNDDFFVSFGATPSGSSWQLNQQQSRVNYSLDSWDLGFNVEHRIHNNFWLRLSTGIAGLRGLFITSETEVWPKIDISAGPYFGASINYRPSVP